MEYITLGQHSTSFAEFKVFKNNEQCGTIFYFSDVEKENIEVMEVGEIPGGISKNKDYINNIAKKLMKADLIDRNY